MQFMILPLLHPELAQTRTQQHYLRILEILKDENSLDYKYLVAHVRIKEPTVKMAHFDSRQHCIEHNRF